MVSTPPRSHWTSFLQVPPCTAQRSFQNCCLLVLTYTKLCRHSNYLQWIGQSHMTHLDISFQTTFQLQWDPDVGSRGISSLPPRWHLHNEVSTSSDSHLYLLHPPQARKLPRSQHKTCPLHSSQWVLKSSPITEKINTTKIWMYGT